MFFEGIRSERELVRVAADRLSVRWYLGYDLDEELPDHSSLTRIRQRYGLTTFRRFFEAIVEQCRAAGLVWGKELYFDATQVDANASVDSIAPRFAVEAHLGELFSGESADVPGAPEQNEPPQELPVSAAADLWEELTEANAARHDWLARDGSPDRTVRHGSYRRRTDFEASATDPDAALMARKKGGLHFGYHDHYAVDGGRARIIVGVLVTPADVMENQPFLDLLWRARCRWRLPVRQVTGDTTYGTIGNIVAVEDQGIRAYVPLPDFDERTPYYGKSRFRYEPERDAYRCPQDHLLRRQHPNYTEEVVVYQAGAATCNACPVKAACTSSDRGRLVKRSFYAEYLDRVRGCHGTPAFQRAMNKRRVWVEPLFGEAKDWHGLRRFRLGATVTSARSMSPRRLRQRGSRYRIAVRLARPWPHRALLRVWHGFRAARGARSSLRFSRGGRHGRTAAAVAS
jgi:IS5 family transposase